MNGRDHIIKAFNQLAESFEPSNEVLSANVGRTYVENNWLTKENYWLALTEWKRQLGKDSLQQFIANNAFSTSPKRVGIIMAGNIPMVGFHDLLCVLLSGNIAIVKPSSDDKYVIKYICSTLASLGLDNKIEVVEKLEKIDAVIATGSNNSFKYFEYYFKSIPSLLRKNRKSLAILDGSETDEDLDNLATDVFQYFGLGCRNVALVFLPKSMNITRVLDHFMSHKDIENHNKFANNYTYHRALLLMNNEQHLDTGFLLCKEKKDLNVPLACLHYVYYENQEEVNDFIQENKENIQCVVGNYYQDGMIGFGDSQKPELQDFADNENTLDFLDNLSKNN
ncbi:MAG: acyl-CoA reductase [Bacteroidia bacterium]